MINGIELQGLLCDCMDESPDTSGRKGDGSEHELPMDISHWLSPASDELGAPANPRGDLLQWVAEVEWLVNSLTEARERLREVLHAVIEHQQKAEG